MVKKRTDTDLQNTTETTKDWATQTQLNSGPPKSKQWGSSVQFFGLFANSAAWLSRDRVHQMQLCWYIYFH